MTGIHRKSLDTAAPAVGRDVEAWCARCARVLDHIIVAMNGSVVVQVKCRTCDATHRYKTAREVASARPAGRAPKADAPGRAPAAPRERTPSTPAAEPAEVRAARTLWQRRMATADRATAVAYAVSGSFGAGQLVDHRTFGYGIVEQATAGKISVLFESGYRLLVAAA